MLSLALLEAAVDVMAKAFFYKGDLRRILGEASVPREVVDLHSELPKAGIARAVVAHFERTSGSSGGKGADSLIRTLCGLPDDLPWPTEDKAAAKAALGRLRHLAVEGGIWPGPGSAAPAELRAPSAGSSNDSSWDVFISHAWEDKDAFVRPLAEELQKLGIKVWYDESTLRLGDGLRKSIDLGIAGSKFGVVVLSPHFFAKHMPQEELGGLLALESNGRKRILPVWLDLTVSQVAEHSPLLAGRYAANASQGPKEIARLIHAELDGGSGAAPVSALPRVIQLLPNGRAYSAVALRGSTTGGELSDEVHRAVEPFMMRLNPEAKCLVATPTLEQWAVLDDGATAAWQARVYPGPSVAVYRAMPLVPIEKGNSVCLELLVLEWKASAEVEDELLGRIGGTGSMYEFGLQTNPSAAAPVVEFSFKDAPALERLGEAHAIPPFVARKDAKVPIAESIHDAVKELARDFSYEFDERFSNWLRETLAVR